VQYSTKYASGISCHRHREQVSFNPSDVEIMECLNLGLVFEQRAALFQLEMLSNHGRAYLVKVIEADIASSCTSVRETLYRVDTRQAIRDVHPPQLAI
jgi:hypothetical protein